MLTITASACCKSLTGMDAPCFIFEEGVQSWASDDEDFLRNVNNLHPHITLYSPSGSEVRLAGEDTSAREQGFDLAWDGGAQICCSGFWIFLSIFAGERLWNSILGDCEKTMGSPTLAMSFSLSPKIMNRGLPGRGEFVSQEDFLNGQPIWLRDSLEISLVVRR